MELCKANFAEVDKWIKETTSHFECDIPDIRILDFFLNSEQYKTVSGVLDRLVKSSGLKDRNEAICELARKYQNENFHG